MCANEFREKRSLQLGMRTQKIIQQTKKIFSGNPSTVCGDELNIRWLSDLPRVAFPEHRLITSPIQLKLKINFSIHKDVTH